MFDLASIELAPAKLAAGVPWQIRRLHDGRVGGDPVAVPPVDEPWVLIVPAGFAYERALDEARRPFAGRKLTDAESVLVTAKALARAVVRGWGNLGNRGELIEYCEAKAVELLSDERWRPLREFALNAAGYLAAAAVQEEERASGN